MKKKKKPYKLPIQKSVAAMFQKQNKGTAYTTFNTIKLLRSGKPYFSTLFSMIEQAKYSIHLQVYIFDEDETGQQVADKLMEATKRGVNVYLMPDGYASKKLSAKFIQSLTDAGVNFSFFEPVLKSEHFYFGRRLHHKVTVVDGFYGLVAGLNISNRYNDMPDEPAWMDWGIYVEGQATQELYKICLEVWCKANKISNKPQHETIQEMVKDNCLVRVRRNDWVKRYNQISRSYVDMLRTSTSHVTIMSSYFIPGWFIRQRLARAARRGVKIRLILTGISDVKIAKGAECYIYRWFHKKNIDVYEYTAGVLHCKLSTQDGKFVTIGSYNVNNLSAYASVELNLDIANEAFAQSTDKQIDEIIEQHCILITPEIYKRRYNIIKTSMQFMSYLIVRMLINISTFYFKQQ